MQNASGKHCSSFPATATRSLPDVQAEAADTVVLAVGTDLQWSAEGHDATTINFTAASTALIEQVAAAAKKPIVVVRHFPAQSSPF